jgi:hypothetical protein
MSEYEQDPSANTGRFRAFVERGDDDSSRSRRMPVSPGVMIAVGVVIVVIVILAVTL